MPEYTLFGWGLVVATAIGTGFLMRTFGQGVGVLLTPLLTVAFSARFSLGLLGIYIAIASIGMTRALWHHWDRPLTYVLVPGETVGLLAGVWVVAVLSEALLRTMIGLICLGLAMNRLWAELRPPKEIERRPLPAWIGTLIGAVSGFAAAVANTGGTVMALFLHARQIQKTVMVATIWAVFFVLQPVKLAAYWQGGIIDGPMLVTSLLTLPVLWAGLRAGEWAHRRISGRVFNLIILGFALAGSLRLLIGG